MKLLLTLTFCCFFWSITQAQTTVVNTNQPDPSKKIKTVEASCGECQFHMEGKGCHLAVRIKGKTYFVDGTTLDDHGDAHAADGFCEAIRQAEVQGKVRNKRYIVTYFKLITPIAGEVKPAKGD